MRMTLLRGLPQSLVDGTGFPYILSAVIVYLPFPWCKAKCWMSWRMDGSV